MATVNTNFVFVGKAQSVVKFGRALTQQESSILRAKRGAMISEGKFGSFPTMVDGAYVYAWVDTAAATEYVDACNAMTPPPTSAVVQDLPEPPNT